MANVVIVNTGIVDLEQEHEAALRYCSRVEALTSPPREEEELELYDDYECGQLYCNHRSL